MEQIQVKSIIGGTAKGKVMLSSQGVSFWGGVDPETGVLMEKGHDLYDRCLAGVILAFPRAKGSAGAAPVIVQMVKNNKAPAALINIRTDPVIAAGAVISKQFYNIDIPIINVTPEIFDKLEEGMDVEIHSDDGILTIV